MALTISTGFVVDDAIVVMENVTRHLEDGVTPREAALHGPQEIGFTVLHDQRLAGRGVHSDPLDGRHRRPAVPRVRRDAVDGDRDLDAGLAHHDADDVRVPAAQPARRDARTPVPRRASAVFDGVLGVLPPHADAGCSTIRPVADRARRDHRAQRRAGREQRPKGFFPQQDTGVLIGAVRGPQDASFQSMDASMQTIVDAIRTDPAVAHVIAFTGTRAPPTRASIFVALKPLASERRRRCRSSTALRPKLGAIPVAAAFLQAVTGSAHRRPREQRAVPVHDPERQREAELATWGPRPARADQAAARPARRQLRPAERRPRAELLDYDRATRRRRSGSPCKRSTRTSYDAFGQSQVSIIYTAAEPVLRRARGRRRRSRRAPTALDAHLLRTRRAAARFRCARSRRAQREHDAAARSTTPACSRR